MKSKSCLRSSSSMSQRVRTVLTLESFSYAFISSSPVMLPLLSLSMRLKTDTRSFVSRSFFCSNSSFRAPMSCSCMSAETVMTDDRIRFMKPSSTAQKAPPKRAKYSQYCLITGTRQSLQASPAISVWNRMRQAYPTEEKDSSQLGSIWSKATVFGVTISTATIARTSSMSAIISIPQPIAVITLKKPSTMVASDDEKRSSLAVRTSRSRRNTRRISKPGKSSKSELDSTSRTVSSSSPEHTTSTSTRFMQLLKKRHRSTNTRSPTSQR
mmetsp:Transcript_52180/g.148922  ORF Transcript_52180/g.148922 Transcript_52180/m.148922 type:complete len:269 (-) Transcript_52180:511-1317(-)